ncbi:MAG: GAF domain-containing protein, partial [Acidobacteria bacterium]|nr:GAF domain-containing protein [Acidobacteriota bacterium]
MEQNLAQISLLHRISSIVSSNRTVDEMLGEIVGMTVQVTGCDACLVYLLEAGSGEIVLRASQVPHAAEIGHLSVQMGQGVTGWVAENKSVVALAENASQDKRFLSLPGLVEDTYEAYCSVPLLGAG